MITTFQVLIPVATALLLLALKLILDRTDPELLAARRGSVPEGG